MAKNQSYIIEGLAGKKTLRGSVSIHGAKNAALKAIAASVLFDGPVTLKNVPRTSDVDTLSEILKKLGAIISWNGDTLNIDASKLKGSDIDPVLAGNMRASVVLTGPLLARFGTVDFPAPGGCVIGARPIDLFISGYEKMGAHTTLDEKQCIYKIGSKSKLTGADIFFNIVTVGGTETLMMAAVLGEGTTILKNCAMEPEIVNVAEWLISCGAKISGVGTPTITIEGTRGKLLSPKHAYVAIPDRIETGSFLFLGALCAKELTIEKCRPDHVESLISNLRDSGIEITTTADTIYIKNNTRPNSELSGFNIRTHEYPGFATDLQPIAVTYLSQVRGESSVFETIYEGRFKYIEDLQKIGAHITVMNPREVLIKGPTPFKQTTENHDLIAHDIRAGFAVVMAALTGTGTFTVTNIHLIDRGYEKLEEQLSKLGASIKRVG